MQLKIQRSQRSGGLMAGKVIFCMDARAELAAEEAANVKKYNLGRLVIYNSEASRRHLESVHDNLGRGGGASLLKAGARLALAKMSLNITIDSLCQGHHIECKDLDELLGAEEAIYEACEGLINYLQVASTFDGREIIVEFPRKQKVAAA